MLRCKGTLDADYLECVVLASTELGTRLRKLLDIANRYAIDGWSLGRIKDDDKDGIERVREELADHEASDGKTSVC